jgi:hypothetical protein
VDENNNKIHPIGKKKKPSNHKLAKENVKNQM